MAAVAILCATEGVVKGEEFRWCCELDETATGSLVLRYNQIIKNYDMYMYCTWRLLHLKNKTYMYCTCMHSIWVTFVAILTLDRYICLIIWASFESGS